MTTSVTYSIYGSSEGFLKSEVTQAWVDAGYTTQSVESSSIWKVGKDILSGIAHLGGLFGGSSGFKSTRYFYNYIQNVTPINGKYIPDQVQTYAMAGELNGEGSTVAVQNGLRTGRGSSLKKYYQYANHRYKDRQWKWQTYRTTNFRGSATVFRKDKFLRELPQGYKYKIVDITRSYIPEGQLYLDWLQREFNIDTFNVYASPIDLTNKPTNNSIGTTIWIGNEQPVQEDRLQLDSVTMHGRPAKVSSLVQVGQSKDIDILVLFDNPYDKSIEPDDSPTDELDIDINNKEVIITVKVTLTNINNGYYTYSLEEIHKHYLYTEEKHYYLSDDGSSNFPDFRDYWVIAEERSTSTEKLTSEDNNMFKFYCIIPIKDWFEGKDTWQQLLPRMNQEQGIVKSIRELSELTRPILEKDSEELQDSSYTGKRTNNKHQRKNIRTKVIPEKKLPISGRVLGAHEVKAPNSERQLQRKITRELNRDRKLKFNADALADIKKWKPERLKRHLEYLSELVGINYMQYVASLMSQDHWNGGYERTNTYQNSIYLGAIFSNQTKENHDYWYEWAKRQYKLQGKEEGFIDWSVMVQSANNLRELPQRVVKYQTTDGTHWGGFSYCFIRKIKIKGRTRKIKRKHRLHDILRGKSIPITTIEQLRNQVEPLAELADDSWYYNERSGKEYPIGGGLFAGRGYTESNDPDIRQVFNNYSYTFFCKNSGKDEITCYAICGLQFHTKMSERKFWCTAWQDLGYEFERLRQKYLDKKNEADIQVVMEVDTGSRKYRHINRIYNFGIVPIEYDVIRRMNAVSLENFAQRCVLNYSFLFQEQKKKRGGMKYVRPIITIVGFIVSVILSLYGQTWSWAVFAKALAISAGVAVAVNIAVKHILIPVLKALGLKGVVAMIILIVIAIIAMYAGTNVDTSALPYASETTGQVASEVGTELATQFTTELLGSNLLESATKLIGYASKAYDEMNKDETSKLQKEMEMEQEKFNQAMKDLEEQQEEMQSTMANYAPRAVLNSVLQAKSKLMDFDIIYANALANQNVIASPDYLDTFLELKLTLDPETFDPIRSTDFSFKQT